MSIRCGIDEQFISIWDVLGYVSNVVFPFIKNKLIFNNFIHRIFTGMSHFGLRPSNTTTIDVVIKEMLSILSLIPVLEDDKILIDLGKPDYTILPRGRL